jgi:U3 small nucleolar RNA-associated protein 24
MGELESWVENTRWSCDWQKTHALKEFPATAKDADDCITNMAKQWRCFIVATCDKGIERTHSKIPGVPCMCVSGYRYTVERMPEALGALR